MESSIFKKASLFSVPVIVVAIAAATILVKAAGQNGTLPIPPLLTPSISNGIKVFKLRLQKGQAQIISGPVSQTMGFNGSFLGPTVRVGRGDAVRMEVTNNIGEDATVHWHGLHVPAAGDGGIEEVIPSGDTWTPQFMINQKASTNWYHPHIMGATAKQLAYGLAGMFIVDDDSSTDAALPNQYGVNDIPLIFQSEVVASNGSIKYDETTFGGDEQYPLLVNGMNVTSLPTFNTNQGRLRLRLLNASIGDVLIFSFTDGQPFSEIATDGGFLPGPLSVTSLRLGPAERAEIIVDLSATRTLQATQETTLLTGGSSTYSVLQINPSRGVSQPNPLPQTLDTIVPLNTSGSPTQTIKLTADGAGFGFGINGVDGTTMDTMMNNAMHVKLGTTDVWSVVNTDFRTHFFHMHDGSFQILSIDGAPPTGDKIGWKDTVEVKPGSTIRVAMQYLDYSDNLEAYMLHCHLAPHEDQGMMALFYVDPAQPQVSRDSVRLGADFDGDGKADLALWRPWDGTWYVVPSSNPSGTMTVPWGTENDVPVPADYDGDGKADLAVWRPSDGIWYVKPSSNPAGPALREWGLPGDIPVPGDYDGDGRADFAVWRPSNGTWYVMPSSNPNAYYAVTWGVNGDTPVAADFDGDNKMDLAVWRPSNGTWYVMPSSNPAAFYARTWGITGDIPVTADFDGDGKADQAAFRPSNGTWYVMPSSNPNALFSKEWGTSGDLPVAHDYDGDKKADLAVFRPISGTWYLVRSGSGGAPQSALWGIDGDTPF